MFRRLILSIALFVGLGSFGFVLGASAQTLDGACSPVITGHTDYTCARVASDSPAFTERHCERGHCGTLTGVFCCAPPVAAALEGGTPNCGQAATAARATPAGAGISADIQADWVCAVTRTSQERAACRAYSGCIALNADALCCPSGTGNTAVGRPGASTAADGQAAAGSAGASSAGLGGALRLPDCATSHDPNVAGKCTLDDIKQVAVNFANFLMGLAAAFFLLIFVYAGFRYIFFAYDSGTAGEARKMLTSSAIGMLLVLGAATIVRFVQTTATGSAPTENRCVAVKGDGYSCQNISRLPSGVSRTNCVPNLGCPGGSNTQCCPTGSAPTGLTPARGATTGPAGACDAAAFVRACHAACNDSTCASVAGLTAQCNAGCDAQGAGICGAARSRTDCAASCESLWSAGIPAAARIVCSNPCDGLCAAAFPSP